MSVLVFAPVQDNVLKKVALEAVSLGARLARNLQSSCVVLTSARIPDEGARQLSDLGVSHHYWVENELADADSVVQTLAQVAAQCEARQVVVSNTYLGKAVAPRLAVRLQLPLASGVIDFPTANAEGWEVRRSVFSNKGFAYLQIQGSSCVLAITPNSFPLENHPNPDMKSELLAGGSAGATGVAGRVRLNRVDRVAGKIPLTEAERVVSAGRGLKGPENWHLVESLAAGLDAATACSKPVSDMHWRPHEEHVGQTGITIKPDLYVAVGISGAIQHLAGVSSSKVIVAINSDKEAPFFKIADYGVVGDAFDVLPRLTEAVQRFKATQA